MMLLSRLVFRLVYQLLLLLLASALATSVFTTSGKITSFVAGPNHTFLVAAGADVWRLSSGLQPVEHVQYSSNATAVSVRWTDEENSSTITVVSLSNQTNLVFTSAQASPTLLTNLTNHISINNPVSSNPVTLCLDVDSFYVGLFGSHSLLQSKVIFLGRFGYDSSAELMCSKTYLTASSFGRVFGSSFESGGYVYFVVEDRISDMPAFRIMRLCDKMSSGHQCFRALYEAQFTGIPVNETSHLVSVQFVKSLGIESFLNVATVIVSVSTNQNGGVYAFKLADLNKKMMESFSECKMHKHVINIPWKTEKDYCKKFGVVCHYPLSPSFPPSLPPSLPLSLSPSPSSLYFILY